MTSDTHRHATHCWWNPEEARWVCNPSTPGTSFLERPPVDVRDMVVVHTALLREFRLAPAAIGRVAPGDGVRAVVVDRHLGFLCELLHHHHEGEDALLWPKLRDRLPAAALEFVDGVEAQHVEIEAELLAVADARADWTREATEVSRDALAVRVTRLHALLVTHLDLEESSVLPLAAGVLTEAEWRAIGEAAVAQLPKPALPLVFGMFAYEGDPAVLRDMLRTAPAVPRLLLPRVAPRVYARRARRVHGTARP